MDIIAYILLSLYLFPIFCITLYCLLQLQLLWFYKKNNTPVEHRNNADLGAPLPFVTIQLPIFNEQHVVERLIDNIIQIDYPKDRFEIQILDDSTDNTLEISQRKTQEYRQQGFNIHCLHRTDRTGFKAGALKAAMSVARGTYIAIFDADFLPRPDFLRQTLPYFKQPKIGLVQTRWEHLNQDYSLLTQMQALQLNVHFTVEQKGRQSGDCFLQFNGTAGIWRRTCIEDAGGWEADTLTEDLDLSYRAQLKGWQMHYLEHIGSPAELPAEMNGIKSQQFRWMKGGAENARKLLPAVWQADLGLRQKIHATGHLMGSGMFLFLFIAAMASVPLVLVCQDIDFTVRLSIFLLLGLLAFLSVSFVANVQSIFAQQSFLKKTIKFIVLFPLFLMLSMGLSLHNAIAVIQGYWGKPSPFVRTPKFALKESRDNFKRSSYLHRQLTWTTILEGMLAIYFLVGVLMGLRLEQTYFLVFHVMLMIGFASIFWYSIKRVN